MQKACNKFPVIYSVMKYFIPKFLLKKQFWSIVYSFKCGKNANTVESPFHPLTTFCMCIRRGFALLGTVWLPECSRTFNLQSMPRGFQTAAWQINSIILLLIFNFYVKITYIVYLAYFLHFSFSASNFYQSHLAAEWEQCGL